MRLDYQENGVPTGQLRFKNGGWLKRLTAKPVIISILPLFARERRAVEEFITDIYARAYQAQIGVHYPVLMSVRDEDGQILAALGFRYAMQEKLFLEQYLDRPVEEILGKPRREIVEIGNLASRGGGASLFLFAALSAYLHHKDMSMAVITGTQVIEQRLRSLGLNPARLAPADPSCLLRENEDWGTYYDSDPHVLCGHIDEGYKKLRRALGAQYTAAAQPRLFPRLHYKGTLL